MIHQEAIIIISIYAPSVAALNFIKQTPMDKDQTDPDTMIAGDLNTLHSSLHKGFKLKINKAKSQSETVSYVKWTS